MAKIISYFMRRMTLTVVDDTPNPLVDTAFQPVFARRLATLRDYRGSASVLIAPLPNPQTDAIALITATIHLVIPRGV